MQKVIYWRRIGVFVCRWNSYGTSPFDTKYFIWILSYYHEFKDFKNIHKCKSDYWSWRKQIKREEVTQTNFRRHFENPYDVYL